MMQRRGWDRALGISEGDPAAPRLILYLAGGEGGKPSAGGLPCYATRRCPSAAGQRDNLAAGIRGAGTGWKV